MNIHGGSASSALHRDHSTGSATTASSSSSSSSNSSDTEISAPTLEEFRAINIKTKHDWNTPIGQDSDTTRAALDIISKKLSQYGWTLKVSDESSGKSSASAITDYDSDS